MTSFKSVMGRFPFAPDKKRPIHMRWSDYLHFLYPPNNPYTSDLNYLIASTDKLLVGIYQLSPGSSFDPIDIHPGDEAYYILEGDLVQQSLSGQFLQAHQGEAIWLPRGVWHRGYNFTDKITSILYFIAPKAWDEHVPPAVLPSAKEQKIYKGENNKNLPKISPVPAITRQPSTDDIGRWPADGPESRKPPYPMYRITEANQLVTIHSLENPMLVKFFVSNDLMHMGEFILPCGGKGPRVSAPDCHKGDCVLFVEKGPITVNLPDTEEAFIVDNRESFIIPEGVRYQLMNFNGYPVKAIFAVAPEL
ncbi:cupin domain-containing protein [Moorellaceae bacterium AZ2]